MPVEYLDPSIANEGFHADKPLPDWMAPAVGADDEWQPDLPAPHINDYAAFKAHKHYGQYFRPYRYRPFPAWMYHATQEPKIVQTKEEALALGPEWSPKPNKRRIDMHGKALPVKTDTQRLTETLVAVFSERQAAQSGGVDANSIAAIVAAAMAAVQAQQQPAAGAAPGADTASDDLLSAKGDGTSVNEETERKALIELAEKDGVKIDGRWSNQRIKKELGLD